MLMFSKVTMNDTCDCIKSHKFLRYDSWRSLSPCTEITCVCGVKYKLVTWFMQLMISAKKLQTVKSASAVQPHVRATKLRGHTCDPTCALTKPTC